VAVAEWQWLLAVAVEQWGSNEPKMSGNGWVLAVFDTCLSKSGSGCGRVAVAVADGSGNLAVRFE
jgi:hypothetical protein